MSTGKRLFFAFFTVVFLTVSLIGIDVVLGIVVPYNRPAKPRNDTTFVVSSPTRIHQFIPNAHFTYDGADYTTNALGFRDVDYSPEKPADTLRIAVLGDSFIEGLGEKQAESLPKQLERNLKQTLGKNVQVLNAGVRGGSPGYYKFWIRTLLDYHPDAFVVCVYDNEMDDDALLLLKKAAYRADMWWNRTPPALRKSSIVSYVAGEWANFQFKRRRKQLSRALFNEDDFVRENKRKDGDANAIGSNSVGYVVEPGKWQSAWERTRANLDEIENFLNERRIPVLFVHIPASTMVPDVPAKPKANDHGPTAAFKQDFFGDWIRTWAEKNHQPFVDLSGPITRWYEDPKNARLYQPDYAHFNQLGLRQAGLWVAPELLKLIGP